MPIYGMTRRSHMDDFIADFFSLAGKEVTRYPLTNIGYDSEDTLHIELALAGFDKDDITIDLKGDVLTIIGSQKESYRDVTWMEHNVSTKDFERRIRIGDSYLGAKISAKMENGVLLVTIPSSEPEKTVISIE